MRYWKPRKILGRPKVGVGVAAYLETAEDLAKLQGLVHCFQAQTYAHWHLLVVHDGPYRPEFVGLRTGTTARVTFVETKERTKQFGHPHRQAAIDRLLKDGCDWVGLTNQDNYYAPVYLEWLLSVGCNAKRPREFVYCDCVHSHQQWRPMVTEPRKGKLDLGGFLVKASLVKQVRFDNFGFNGDGIFIDRLRNKARGIEKVPAALFVHN